MERGKKSKAPNYPTAFERILELPLASKLLYCELYLH